MLQRPPQTLIIAVRTSPFYLLSTLIFLSWMLLQVGNRMLLLDPQKDHPQVTQKCRKHYVPDTYRNTYRTTHTSS